mgnify:CR=1 FL=1
MPICVLNRPPHDDIVQNSIAAQYFKKYQMPARQSYQICNHVAPAWTVLNIPLNEMSSTIIRSQKGKI